MFGFALAVAYLFSVVSARHDTLAVAIAGVLVLTLAVASVARNMIWQNPVAFWKNTVSKAPSSHRARNNLGACTRGSG